MQWSIVYQFESSAINCFKLVCPVEDFHITEHKSLVQPHLDYCSQLWSPSSQGHINKLENVQKSLVNKIWDKGLDNKYYWDKLQYLRLFSQERRRERYQIIFIWKISQGLVSGYQIPFSQNSRTGRWAVPAQLSSPNVPSAVRVAK